MYIPWRNYSNNILYEVYTIYYCIVCGQYSESLLLLATYFLLGGARKDLGGAKPLFPPLKYAYGCYNYSRTCFVMSGSKSVML